MQISTNIHSTVRAVLKSLTEVDIEFATKKSKSFSLNMRNELNGLMKSLGKTVLAYFKNNSEIYYIIIVSLRRIPNLSVA